MAERSIAQPYAYCALTEYGRRSSKFATGTFTYSLQEAWEDTNQTLKDVAALMVRWWNKDLRLWFHLCRHHPTRLDWSCIYIRPFRSFLDLRCFHRKVLVALRTLYRPFSYTLYVNIWWKL
ncbi:Protein of unknown function [Pyronema omphalodes CBS 100304]|uniref:Uncharacterized protein n=1 Tax=Pyronema omphalodes (strain CBS 100304) TaxID=1076935 RepID=U4LN25_PYROM|nr:Protein of unknown function [Pyronema omphalodes CBS 100304]